MDYKQSFQVISCSSPKAAVNSLLLLDLHWEFLSNFMSVSCKQVLLEGVDGRIWGLMLTSQLTIFLGFQLLQLWAFG